MKRFFLINILLFLFSIMGSVYASDYAYPSLDIDTIELLEDFETDPSDIFEIVHFSTDTLKNAFLFDVALTEIIQVKTIIKEQHLIFANIKRLLQSIFITTQQSKILPQEIS